MVSTPPRTIWYMGAKTRLTAEIERAVEQAAPRAESALDLMCGTGIVSWSLAERYRVVANDVQAYAAAVARAYLEAPTAQRLQRALDPVRDLGSAYARNRDALLEWLGPAVATEDAYLRAEGLEPESLDPAGGAADWAAIAVSPGRGRVSADPDQRARDYRRFALEQTPHFLEGESPRLEGPFRRAKPLFDPRVIAQRRSDPTTFPYSLACAYYPNVYLGLRQAIAVDSLRYAIDQLPRRGALAAARRSHYLAALLHAVSVTTSATSHFCQPRGLTSPAEVKAVLIRRAQSIPSRMLAYSREIAGAAGSRCVAEHAVCNSDWRQLYRRWDEFEVDVVYADPPYTQDNYSRFYHALEVLTRYDYPALQRGGHTKGRYPDLAGRHRSAFCRRGQVEQELRDLCQETARRGAALVLSYGLENGLLFRRYETQGLSRPAALERFADLARESYRQVELHTKALMHSGQGDSNHTITELLLVARRPRKRSRRKDGRQCA